MVFHNKKILIVGFGISGKSAFSFLQKNDCKIVVYDEKIKSSNKNLIGNFDLAILSHGIKTSSEAIKFIKQNNIPFLQEFELGLLNCKCENVVGITGTNGKTTCVSLLENIIKHSGKNAVACGNNGVCLTSVCDSVNKDDFCILELSSFMLEKAKNLHLKVAGFLNFQSDHLDVHSDLKTYFNCKKRIFDFQNKNDFSVLNADDKKVSQLRCKGETFYFSTRKKVKGVYVYQKNFHFFDGENDKVLFPISKLQLMGEFNLSNACLCILIALLLKIENSAIEKGVESFLPVKHRLNLIYNKAFKVFNDSKSTNVASLNASLKCFRKNIILILGGSDKGENFDDVFKFRNKFKKIILTGKTARKLKYYSLKNEFNNFKIIKNFKKAVVHGLKMASVGDVVLFSPACASFDKFKNFEQRGEVFEKIVEKYFEKTKN